MAVDWAGERVLVTGGTGMIGANLLRRLVLLGNRPFVLIRDRGLSPRIAEIQSSLECLQGDVTDPGAVERAVGIAKPGIVFHLASSYFNPPTLSASEHMNTIAMGMVHICDALNRSAVSGQDRKSRLIAAGSCAVYAGGSKLSEDAPIDPGSMLGVAKASAGMIGRHFAERDDSLEFLELRLFTPFGPWEAARRLIPDVVLNALDGKTVKIGRGDQQRDYVYIDDVIDALILAGEVEIQGQSLPLNIGGGVGRPIRDVAARILDLMGNPVELEVGALAGRPDEIWEISADFSAAARNLGWQPRVSFDDGLRRSIDWIRDHHAIARELT